MADVIKTESPPAASPTVATVTPAATEASTPVAAAPAVPVAAPAADAAPAAPATTPSPETPIAAAPAEPPPRDATILESFDADRAAKDAAAEKAKAPEAKPATDAAKPADPAKPADAAKPAEAAPAEIKYEFQVPEVIKADHPRMETFTALLRDTKAAPETGQKLLNMAAEVMSEYATQLRADQYSAFNDTRAGWRKMVMADPELGGSGHQTALAAAARMRDLLISSAKPGTPQYERDLKEFQDFDRATGASDHPALLRLLHNAARFLDEPQAASVPRDIKPPKGNGRPPKGGIYTHPSSANMER